MSRGKIEWIEKYTQLNRFLRIRQGILAMSALVRAAASLLLAIGVLFYHSLYFDIPTTNLDQRDSSLVDQDVKVAEESVPPLREFLDSLEYVGGDAVIGIYVPGTLAMPVLQQPAGIPYFVSTQSNVVTQFELASRFYTVGLLAHNYLGGAKFFHLEIGELVYLVIDDGSLQVYVVSEVLHYQALSPKSPTSDFRSLDYSSGILSVEDLFYKIYAQRDRVILQTCLSENGVLNWGRLFVVAVPNDKPRIQLLGFGNLRIKLGTRGYHGK